MTTKPEYPWLQNVCYEPAPTLIPSGPTTVPLGWRVFLILAALACVGGALAAVSV